MAGKTRSTASKAASAPKVQASFSSSKRTTSASSSSSKKAVSSTTAAAVAPPKKENGLSGLYNRLYKDAKKKMGPAIHREGMDDIETILLQFDHTEEYGPCSRISRLERFERAEKLGLNPDPEIGDILRSEEGKTRKEYSESVFQI